MQNLIEYIQNKYPGRVKLKITEFAAEALITEDAVKAMLDNKQISSCSIRNLARVISRLNNPVALEDYL